MRENAGAADKLLQRMTELLARVRAFELSLHSERVEVCAELRKHQQDIPAYERWCGSYVDNAESVKKTTD